MSTSIQREMERKETYGNNSCNTSYSLWIRRADLKMTKSSPNKRDEKYKVHTVTV